MTAIWAKKLGISESTINKAKAVSKKASEEDIQAIKDGKASVKKIYNKIKQPQNAEEQDINFVVNDAQSLPANVSFLKGAVILLVESKETKAAELLINHFLRKNERHGFYNLLPEAVSAQLAISVPGTLIDP